MSAFGSAQLPKTGDLIGGKYAIERIIGQGGMGAVFAARHVKLGHAVAIKVMLADRQNEEAARRFMNEGRASAHIQNDHVVRISDIDEEHGYAYMVLELLDGEDLAQVLEQQVRLSSHVAVGYVLQALEGVRQAHALGIVHRDLKPSNLFLARRQDGSVVVKVLDFGISKANSKSSLDMAPGQLTSTAAMLGSPLYMSPEQLRSSKNVDARADIWAMGVILYELLTGVVPFEGETLGALFAAILETEAPSARARMPSVPAGLDAIVIRCLQRKVEDRFQSVAELERALLPFATAAAAPASASLAFSAIAPPGGVPVAMPGAMSGAMPGAPAYGAMARSGSMPGSDPSVVQGTVPLGAITPQPYQQTGNTWQSTGARPRPKSSTGLVVAGVCVVLLCGGVGLATAALISRRHVAAPASSTATTSSGGPETTPLPATAPGAPAATSSVPSSAASSATLVAAPPVAPPAAPVAPTVKHFPVSPPTTAKVDPPKTADPPKIDPPKTATPPVHPPPAATAGTLQGNR